MNKKLFSSIILLIISINLNAQFGYGKPEDIEQIKRVPLLVVLLSEKPKDIEKLSENEEKLNAYKNYIDSFNISITKYFEKYWHYSTEIKFITEEELKIYDTKSNKGKYAYLMNTDNVGRGRLIYDEIINDYRKAFFFHIYLIGKNKNIHQVITYPGTPSEADIKFMTVCFQSYFDSRLNLPVNSGIKLQDCKNKILLIDKEDIKTEAVEELESKYKFNYKLISKQEIDSLLLVGDTNMIVLKNVPGGSVTGGGSITAFIVYDINFKGFCYFDIIEEHGRAKMSLQKMRKMIAELSK